MIGPTGNLLPLRTPTPLVEDLSLARLAWVSEDNDLGHGKYSSVIWAGHDAVEEKIGPDAKVHPGNWAGVVVADGRVYGASYRNAGPVFTAPYQSNTGYDKSPKPAVPTRFRVEAEDLVICFDAANGKVLWKAVEPGGLICSGSKRDGFQVAPAVDDGRVFAVGSTGRVFAYDAVSGKKLWQGDVGDAYKTREKLRVERMAQAAAGKIVLPDRLAWGTSVVAADGIVVTGDFAGGLRGYDAATGALKWTAAGCISPTATPNVWRHKGKAWILCASTSLFLIDPQNGKVAWKVDGLGPNPGTLAPGERSVMVNIKASGGGRKGVPGIWGCYRLSPEKAEKAWAMADTLPNSFNITGDARTGCSTRIRDGRVLVMTEGTINEGGNWGKTNPGRIALLDEETGAEIVSANNAGPYSSVRAFWGNVLWLDDRAIVRTCNGHGRKSNIFIDWIVTPKTIAPRFGDEKRGLDLIEYQGSYDIVASTPLVDGWMFERTVDGRLACYDLRRPLNPGPK
jgi:outer membrane protein assembly factor BamB